MRAKLINYMDNGAAQMIRFRFLPTGSIEYPVGGSNIKNDKDENLVENNNLFSIITKTKDQGWFVQRG